METLKYGGGERLHNLQSYSSSHSRVISSEGESSADDLTSAIPRKAFETKQCSDSSIFYLQIGSVLPQVLCVVYFLPESLIAFGNAVIKKVEEY